MSDFKNLDDYSGPFDPNIRYEDFSKEALGRLIEEYCRLGFRLDGTWQEVIRKRSGVDEATAAEDQVWEHLVPFWQTRVAKALNIKGDDVATFLKLLQMDPQMCRTLMGPECVVEDETHGRFGLKTCHAVKYFKHMTGDLATLRKMCVLDEVAFNGIAKYVNPKMKVEKVYYPTDPGAPECPNCQFRVWIDPNAVVEERAETK